MISATAPVTLIAVADGIVHDFNNLLAVILNYAELGAADAEGDVAEAFSEISKAGQRAADLTSRLLVFSTQEVAKAVTRATPLRAAAGAAEPSWP